MKLAEINWKNVIIRVTIWYGAILDLLIALAFTIYALSPADTFVNIVFNFSPITEMNYMLIAMENALMFGWTILLIWTDRKPIERRAILAMTIFVAGGILLFNTIGVIQANSFIPIYSIILGSVTVFLFTLSFILAKYSTKKQQKIDKNHA